MGLFVETAEKFTGFGAKKAATEALREHEEAAAFFEKLGISTEGSSFARKTQKTASRFVKAEREGFTFEHVTENEKRMTYLRKGEEKVGYVAFDVSDPKAPRVTGAQVEKAFQRQGLATMMYKAGFSDVFETVTQAQKITSDTLFGTSEQAKGIWRKLSEQGYEIRPSAPRSLPNTGSFIEENGFEISRDTMNKVARQISEDMLKAGAGNDATTLLRRDLRTTGSKKQSAAL